MAINVKKIKSIYIYNNNNIIRLYLLSVGQKNMKDIINTSSETKEEEKEKEKEEIEKEKDVEKVIKCCYGCGSTDHLYKDCQNKSNINPYILYYYNIYIICREEEENEVNKIKEEENIYDINKNDSSFFQTLISKPEGDDILLYAIPVSVPIEAAKVFYFILFIQNYKYKVKLTPGQSKRGKSLKTILDYFFREASTVTVFYSFIIK